MISAVIVNFNESVNLERCLKSLKDFADEIVILDLGSTDSSISVCKKYNAKVFHHDFVPFVEKVRNEAVLKARGEWILVLDPDEAISNTLKDKLKQVAGDDKFQAVNIPRKNIFFGRWIVHTNWWPDRHVRFFRKGHVRWENSIHKYPQVSGKVLDLEDKESLAITHDGYDSIRDFLDRQNRYSDIEAQNLYENGKRFSWLMFFWRPAREFSVRYIRHAGFLDSFYGLALTILMMIYQMQVVIKLWELEKNR